MLTRRSLLLSSAIAAAPAAAQTHRQTILERAKMLEGFAGQRLGKSDIERADKIASGIVYFYGSTPVNVGLKDIDWTGSHIHHQEWPAQLNRFFHLDTLAAAYQSTRDERYPRAARAYIEDWIRGDPYESARTTRPGDNTLNISIRLGTSVHAGWGGTLPAFLASPAFDDAFLESMLASIARQARFLSHHLTDAGNWRISQLDALVFTALRFPFLPDAARLLEDGIRGMYVALSTQFLPDGVHIERSPGYADWMAQVAANYFLLPRIFPAANARVKEETVVHSLDYGAQDELFGVNDSSAPARDPDPLGRLAARNNTLERVGLKDRYPAAPPLEQVFPDAGQVFVRSEWKPGADYIAFDASTWGGGHSHLSRLSFVFRSRGRVMVADPGIFSYEMSDPMGPYGKSTPAHSTVNLNGWNQSAADARLLRTVFTRDAALIHARYQGGYWEGTYGWSFGKGRGRGVYGTHDRILLWVRGEYALVLDAVDSDRGADARNVFQLGPMEKWSHDPANFAWWSENADGNLLLQMVQPPAGASMQCFEGSREPIRGWVGSHGNDKVPAPLVEFRYPAPAVSAVLLAAYSGTAKPSYKATVNSRYRLTVQGPDGSTDEIAWSPGLELPVDESARTNAVFAWRRGSARQFIVEPGAGVLR